MRLTKARERSVLEHDVPELVPMGGPRPSIKDIPPLIYHSQEMGQEEYAGAIQRAFARYRGTIQDDRRLLLDRFKLTDTAIEVVGVGSLGTFCGILLMMASDHDRLFHRFKQARPSILEAYAGKSLHSNHAQRIVHGYRMMQSAGDPPRSAGPRERATNSTRPSQAFPSRMPTKANATMRSS
ncbi:MAG: DUF2252 family protein [Polyangiales bacterium]